MSTKRITDPNDELGHAAERLFHVASSTAPPGTPIELLLGGTLQAASAPLRYQGLDPYLIIKAYALALGTTIALISTEAEMEGIRDSFWRIATSAFDATLRSLAGEGGVMVTAPSSAARGH